MNIICKLQKHRFLFQQLVHRDFTKKYKRTVLGIGWSMLSPLLTLLVMNIVFSSLLGSDIPHYTIYLFSGQLVYSFFNEATNQGMTALLDNADIFTKVNVPKYMFLFSKNVSSLINFGLTLIIYFIFVVINGIPFTWKFIFLLYPVVCLVIFNLGMGLILSALYLFFRDIQYLYSIFTMLLMYMSAIFYDIGSFPQFGQNLFCLIQSTFISDIFAKLLLKQPFLPWSFIFLQLHMLYLYLQLAVGFIRRKTTVFYIMCEA